MLRGSGEVGVGECSSSSMAVSLSGFEGGGRGGDSRVSWEMLGFVMGALRVWKMRFMAEVPASAVRELRSAPTKPGVIFARDLKSKSPERRSFWDRTRRILRLLASSGSE